jgi:catechol 2,3-dioxygenase-like lactoylglutathione lyase family enzyme
MIASVGPEWTSTTAIRPAVHHLGYLVDDIATAAGIWAAALGVGPFLLSQHIAFDTAICGETAATFDHSAAFAAWGDTFIELQQVHEAKPSKLAQGLGQGRPRGLNHIAYAVGDPAAESARLTDLGLPILLHATIGGVELTWHDAWDSLGYAIEVHRAGDALHGFFDTVRSAAAKWDRVTAILRDEH